METTDIFSQMADRYDTEDRIKSAKIIAKEIRATLAGTHIHGSALDYGCGTGLVGLELVDIFDSLLLVDPVAPMIEQVDKKIKNSGIQTAGTSCCDFLTQPLPLLQFDCILLSQVLLHIKNTRLILTRLYDALKDGGHLIIVDFDKNDSISSDKVHNGFLQSELANLLAHIGYHRAGSHTFYHGKNLFMNQDASLFILDAKK